MERSDRQGQMEADNQGMGIKPGPLGAQSCRPDGHGEEGPSERAAGGRCRGRELPLQVGGRAAPRVSEQTTQR